jgi:hypothetical protein
MTTNMKSAQELMYGVGGLGVSNFKMFPGFKRDASPEMIAGNVVSALNDALAGTAEDVSIEDATATA